MAHLHAPIVFPDGAPMAQRRGQHEAEWRTGCSRIILMVMAALKNNRRENFCLGVAKGLTATQAYREAGYRGQGHVGESGASDLMRKPEVIARIAELRARQVKRLDVTIDSLVAELDEMLRLAIECEMPSAGVSAVMGKAKLLGLIVDKSEVGTAIRKPAREATDKQEMSLEEWQAKFAPN